MKEQKKNKGAITENTVNITYALRCQQARYKPSAGHKICIKLKMAESRYIIMLRGSRSGPVEIAFFFKSFLSGRILDRQRVDGHRLSIGQNRAEQSTLRILRCHFDERKSAARIFLLRILLKISRRSMILSRRGIYGCIAKAFFWH